MNDMNAVIEPKSDQLNADSLIGGPITITITKVAIRPGTEQPVSIFFEGDNGKPYKCCKSMARVMVQCWGADANEYVGRTMTLYRDPAVLWGGMAVGGIRISHMTHIDATMTMALTATKGSKKLFTVKPLAVQSQAAAEPPDTFIGKAAAQLSANSKDAKAWVQTLLTVLAECPTATDLTALETFEGVPNARAKAPTAIRQQIEDAFKKAGERLAGPPQQDADATNTETGEEAA